MYLMQYYKTVARIINVWYAHTMLSKRIKTRVIKDVTRHESDTGSPEVQVALLTRQITELTKHLKKNNKDNHSRRGLLQMVADRRTHLRYLEIHNKRRYNMIIKKMGLKH